MLIALGIIAMVPTIASKITNITTLQGLGATSLIIMVGVALDFINQIKTHMLAKNYESFLKARAINDFGCRGLFPASF